MKATDEQIKEAWKRTRNYAEVGRELGIAKQTASYRVHRLRAQGIDLPPGRARGYVLTSERAREISAMRKDRL